METFLLTGSKPFAWILKPASAQAIVNSGMRVFLRNFGVLVEKLLGSQYFGAVDEILVLLPRVEVRLMVRGVSSVREVATGI